MGRRNASPRRYVGDLINLPRIGEEILVKAQHIDRVGADERKVELIGRLLPVFSRNACSNGIVHADIENRPRPAPIGGLAGGAYREQIAIREEFIVLTSFRTNCIHEGKKVTCSSNEKIFCVYTTSS